MYTINTKNMFLLFICFIYIQATRVSIKWFE